MSAPWLRVNVGHDRARRGVTPPSASGDADRTLGMTASLGRGKTYRQN